MKLARTTGSVRVQNIKDKDFAKFIPEDWVATEKLDGTSATFLKDTDGNFIVASRNYKVAFTGNTENMSVWEKVAIKYGIEDILEPGQVIQGEIVGQDKIIRNNPYNIGDVEFFVFNWENINENDRVWEFVVENQVPVLDLEFPKTVKDAIEQVNGMKSTVNPKALAEGVVWVNIKGEQFSILGDRSTFKVISNKYLLKEK